MPRTNEVGIPVLTADDILKELVEARNSNRRLHAKAINRSLNEQELKEYTKASVRLDRAWKNAKRYINGIQIVAEDTTPK